MADFGKLIGMTIGDAKKLLGYWWTLSSVHLNCSRGFYTFNRAPCGYIELRTENNVVVSEHHNGYAEKYFRLSLG